MRNMVLGALLAAGAFSLAATAGRSSDLKAASTEVRVFVLDKTGAPVDVKNWTGAIDVMPAHGQRKAFKLEPVSGKMEGMKEGAKEGTKDTKEGYKEGYKDQKDTAKGKTDQHATGKTEGKEPICGQVKELDDWYVEMVVLRPGATTYHKGGEGTPGSQDEGKASGKAWSHTHGGTFFKANVDDAAIKDSKTGVVNFTATVAFTLPNGDTKYVKGFSYPQGVIDDVFTRIADKDLKDTSKLDHEQAAQASHKIQTVIHSLPPLSFKDAEDRQEYEKAKQDCMAACHRMEQATGKDIADAADKCKSALKEVRSQAKDAEGVLSAE